MDDEFVDTSDFPGPVISHCDPQHPTAVFDGQLLQEWLDDSPLLTWHLHQCYSPMAESGGLKHVEDLLTNNDSYGMLLIWLDVDGRWWAPCHTVRFQSLSLRQGVTWNRYIWGKDGPCSTWSSHFAVGFRSSAPTIRPRRCWLLVAGFQWQFLAGYPNIKSNTHPDVFGWHVTHIMSWSGDIQMAVDWNPWNHLVNPTK